MKLLLTLGVLSLLLHDIVCPPVTTKKPGSPNEPEPEPEGDLSEYMEYHRYLQEVVQALESDPEFRDKLTKAEEVDIRSGKIAHELEYVNHNVRTKLDELKRQELERLRHLATKQFELSNDIDTDHLKIKEHLDHTNEHTFEVEDLKKLILKTTADLAEADKKRRQEFKEYEMQKEFEKQEKLKSMDEEHRKEYEKQIHEQEEKHKKHEPLHHPGSKQQLEEVWEKQDHMENQNFDPRTFFMLHDLDGNGVWDQDEVKALFLKELDKLYQSGVPEDDMRERAEEMERMREHVFGEADTNRDGLISYKEFLSQTQKDEFQRDSGWDSLDKQQFYTHEEYQQFEQRRQEEIQKMIQQGMLPPNPYGDPNGQVPPNGQFPPQGHPNYQNMHPDQMQYQQHHNQGQQYHNQGQQYPNQDQQHPIQGQQHPIQGQQHPNQGQQHPNQGQQHPNQGQQHPNQGQQHPNQGQQHPNQGQQYPNQGQQYPNQGQQHPSQGQHPNANPNQGQQININHGNSGEHPNAIPIPGQQQLNNIGNANQPHPPPNTNQQHLNMKDHNNTPNHGQNNIGNQIPQVDNHISQKSNEHVASIDIKNAGHAGSP